MNLRDNSTTDATNSTGDHMSDDKHNILDTEESKLDDLREEAEFFAEKNKLKVKIIARYDGIEVMRFSQIDKNNK